MRRLPARLLSFARSIPGAGSSRPAPPPAAPLSQGQCARRDSGAAPSSNGARLSSLTLVANVDDALAALLAAVNTFPATAVLSDPPGQPPRPDSGPSPAEALALATLHVGAAALLFATLPWRLAAAHWPEI